METRRRKLAGFFVILAALAVMASCSRKPCLLPPQQYTAPSPSTPRPQGRAATPPSPAPAPAPAPSTEALVVEKCLVNPASPRTITHEVGPLETIWRISRMYDVPPKAIYPANGMKPGEALRIGQKLTIPNAKGMRNIIPLYPSSKWKYIIVHHTATDIGKALQVNRSHEDRGFWHGLGYHFLIDNGTLGKGDGQIEVSPRWIKQQDGAHCKAGGMNQKAIGVALVGNFDVDQPTRNQLDSLAYLLNTLSRRYRIPGGNIMGHRDVPGAATDCPGKRFPWPTVRRCLSAY